MTRATTVPASTPESRAIEEGLAKIAHAIRRSNALQVAMSILPPDSTVEDLKRQAEELAGWIGGKALARESLQEPAGAPLGQPWPPAEG